LKNNKPLKTLTWKYGTVKIFIWIIVFLIVMCLAGAWIFYICNKEFGYSALLNVSGGLFTGLILLSYQYLSNQNLNTANMIVTQLELIDIIPVQYIDIIDFCSDYNLVPQDELDTINIEEILKDNEGAAYALDTCTKAIQKAENQFNNIKEFSNTVLIIPLDFLGYEKALAEIKRFFSVYSQEVQYATIFFT